MTLTNIPISAVTAMIKTLYPVYVPELNVYDTSDLQNTIPALNCPVLYPEPRGGFLSNFQLSSRSLGMDGERSYTLDYRLRYSLAFAPVGQGRSLYDLLPGCFDMVKCIYYAVVQNNTLAGQVIMSQVESVLGNGIVLDPGGTQFFGYTFLLKITEYNGGL